MRERKRENERENERVSVKGVFFGVENKCPSKLVISFFFFSL
jgi:hypothetical protein